MTRVSALLLLAVILSALYLVHTQYAARRLFTELDRAVAQSRQLETERQRLQVDKRAQATPLRIESLARDKLNMRTASPAITQYVLSDGTLVASPQALPAPANGGRR